MDYYKYTPPVLFFLRIFSLFRMNTFYPLILSLILLSCQVCRCIWTR